MAQVSRSIPPFAAVMTSSPALGGPSSTCFHSSSEKSAFFVIPHSSARVGGRQRRPEVTILRRGAPVPGGKGTGALRQTRTWGGGIPDRRVCLQPTLPGGEVP